MLHKIAKKRLLYLTFGYTTCCLPPAKGWGFVAHKKINEQAVFLLPIELLSFYKTHLEFIREEAVKPDKRRYAVEGEAQKHYFNFEDYQKEGPIPTNWYEAERRYSPLFMRTYGTLPWNLYHMKKRLTRAFERKDLKQILRLSADLGHYVADAHVPLHTSSNYDGQLTHQHGIHALWETRLVEDFLAQYDFVFEEKATYLPDVQATAWAIIHETHPKADKLLQIEKEIAQKIPHNQQYVFQQRGKSLQLSYTLAYAQTYHHALQGMIEQQIRAAIRMVASFWLTAWIDAGSPSLHEFDKPLPPPNEEIPPPFIQNIRPHEYQEGTEEAQEPSTKSEE